MRRKYFWMAAVVLFVFWRVIEWYFAYRPSEFIGAGPMKSGAYEYEAPVGSIPLHGSGSYQFGFSGVPSIPMTLLLGIQGGTDKDWDNLHAINAEIEIHIVDSAGNEVCMIPKVRLGSLTLMASYNEAAFYSTHSHDCYAISMLRNEKYRLLIDVSTKEDYPYVIQAYLGGGSSS